MCLAIPGRVIEIMPGEPCFAVVEVLKVKRVINADLLIGDGLQIGDWVLIHVGFAMSLISEEAAREQLEVLAVLGEDREALEELDGYRFGPLEAT